jgi:hypothetical protein
MGVVRTAYPGETADAARTARHSVDATEREVKALESQMNGLDARVGEAGTLASSDRDNDAVSRARVDVVRLLVQRQGIKPAPAARGLHG